MRCQILTITLNLHTYKLFPAFQLAGLSIIAIKNTLCPSSRVKESIGHILLNSMQPF